MIITLLNCSLSPDFCLVKKTLNLAKMHWWIWCLRLWTRAIWATDKCMKDRRFITWVNSFIKIYVYSKRTRHWAMILFLFFYLLKWYPFLESFFYTDIAKFTIVNCRGFSTPIKQPILWRKILKCLFPVSVLIQTMLLTIYIKKNY